MEGEFQAPSVVDPEVRAYVYSLVTALGGTSSDELGSYVLGDDALACLRDIKRWLKLYDEKTNRLDVARCLAEANLVNGDILPILASWLEDGKEHRLKSRVALGCLELLVPLTWPMETSESTTVNHHRHMPYLLQAQVRYKRGILNYEDARILRTVIRISLPSMSIPRSERSSRDEGIIKLLLYFLRNITIIAPSPHLPMEGDENEVSRSATIEAFRQQEVFALLLTMASNMGEDFSFQDVPLLEILFHLLKGVNVERLFMDEEQRKSARTGDLKDILKKESEMTRDYAKNAPTRHGRFGTMIWVKRDDGKMSTVSGQDTLKDGQKTMQRMDETKRWNKPTQRTKDDKLSFENFDMSVTLTSSATRHLRVFVEEFLDSGFNPLFTHLRKAIEREAERVNEADYRQFFFLISWFLEAERMRRKAQLEAWRKKNSGQDMEPDSFALVASVLNQETFISLNRYMQGSYDHKEWQDLNASMRCFTQILMTVQEMAQSPLEEDQEIAENIQNRIFYEETTHDRVLSILRGYKDQGFGYLDACTELSHVFLRMLERYSKENVDLQVRSRRKARRKKEKEQPVQPPAEGADDASEAEELAEAARVSKERKFDFTRFSAKFATQKCVDTFVAFTKYYKDLSLEQLKRAHRFFYRVAFKQDLTVILYRLDIISLLYKMIKGPEGLDKSKPIFKEWDEFVRQLLKRLIRKLDERPQLIVELLFSKIPATLHFLEYGEEKQTITATKAPAELEVNPNGAASRRQKIAIVVAALFMDDKIALAQWVANVLKEAADERISWEGEAAARAANETGESDNMPGVSDPVKHPSSVVKPDSDTCRTAMFKNSKLRLLMTLVGFERLGIDDMIGATWIIPSSLPGADLDDSYKLVEDSIKDPLTNVDGYDPRAQLRRKRLDEEEAPRAEFIDDSEGESNVEEEFLYPANPRSKLDLPNKPKKKLRRKRDQDEEAKILDEETLDARRLAREQAALERRRKIKSEAYIRDSDDESDPEADKAFFAREAERRKRNEQHIMDALKLERTLEDSGTESKKRKSEGDGKQLPKRRRQSGDEEESDNDLFSISEGSSQRRKSNSSEQAGEAETPLSSQSQGSGDDDVEKGDSPRLLPMDSSPALKTTDDEMRDVMQDEDEDDEDNEDDEEEMVASRPRDRRRRGLFVDSDDSE